MHGAETAERPILLYLHLPKAAGTTLNTWLYSQFVTDQEAIEEGGKLICGVFYYPSGYIGEMDAACRAQVERVLARPDLQAVLGHFHFGIHRRTARPSAYVTVLRDPVERVISLYRFHRLVQRKRGSLEGVTIPEDMDLEAFVTAPPYPEVDNGQTRRIAGASPPAGACTPALLDQARANLREAFAVVGTTEQFDETLVLLRRAFHLPEAMMYYPQNVNSSPHQPVEASDAVRRLIADRNALDVSLYEEAKERLREQVDRGGEAFGAELARFQARQQAWLDKAP